MFRRTAGTLSMLAATFAITAALQAADPVQTYNVDPVHSAVAFKIRHFVSKVEGQFKDFSGTITGDPANPSGAAVSFTIKAASIDTRVDQRDKHLRSADFFDVEKYPEITFQSTKITPKGGEKFDVTGTFTMHGVTKEITVPVDMTGSMKDPWGNEHVGFSIDMTLNRKDYGIVWNKVLDQGGTMLGDDVDISIELDAVHKAAAAPQAPAPPSPPKK